MAQRAPEPVTVARIERALALCAYLVARDEAGIVYAPIMDRLEAELIKARAAEDPVFRARRLLVAYAERTSVAASPDRSAILAV